DRGIPTRAAIWHVPTIGGRWPRVWWPRSRAGCPPAREAPTVPGETRLHGREEDQVAQHPARPTDAHLVHRLGGRDPGPAGAGLLPPGGAGGEALRLSRRAGARRLRAGGGAVPLSRARLPALESVRVPGHALVRERRLQSAHLSSGLAAGT